MKKIYTLVMSMLLTGAAVTAQDTLSTHFEGTPASYTVTNGGYVMGNNSYGDIAKMQLFDADYGYDGSAIESLLLLIPNIEDNGGEYIVTIWENVAGVPGEILGEVTIPIADTDTTVANLQIGNMEEDVPFIYNVSATFDSPVDVNGSSFWAGVQLPTTQGDTIGIYSTTDGDFPDAVTHTGELWNDGTFATLGNAWPLNIAMAVFPVISGTTSIEELKLEGVDVYSYNDVVTVDTKGNYNEGIFKMYSVTGQLIVSENFNSTTHQVNTSSYASGIYLVTVTCGDKTGTYKIIKQ